MEIVNNNRSVTTTPHSPELAEYAAVMVAATITVVYLSIPSKTPEILIAAKVTVAMIMTLKNTPK